MRHILHYNLYDVLKNVDGVNVDQLGQDIEPWVGWGTVVNFDKNKSFISPTHFALHSAP